ncbi:MAG: hypothetical protein ACSLE1_15795 [Sphingobium sp.]
MDTWIDYFAETKWLLALLNIGAMLTIIGSIVGALLWFWKNFAHAPIKSYVKRFEEMMTLEVWRCANDLHEFVGRLAWRSLNVFGAGTACLLFLFAIVANSKARKIGDPISHLMNTGLVGSGVAFLLMTAIFSWHVALLRAVIRHTLTQRRNAGLNPTPSSLD